MIINKAHITCALGDREREWGGMARANVLIILIT